MRGIWIAVIGAFCLICAVACTSAPLVTFPEGPADAVTSEPADVIGPLHMRGRELVDATGRVVLIHGTNVVNKSEPFLARSRTDGLDRKTLLNSKQTALTEFDSAFGQPSRCQRLA